MLLVLVAKGLARNLPARAGIVNGEETFGANSKQTQTKQIGIWLLSVQAAQNAWRAHLADVIFWERATERFHNAAHRRMACSTHHKRKIGSRSWARPKESLGVT
jgi:hypothetical protein